MNARDTAARADYVRRVAMAAMTPEEREAMEIQLEAEKLLEEEAKAKALANLAAFEQARVEKARAARAEKLAAAKAALAAKK